MTKEHYLEELKKLEPLIGNTPLVRLKSTKFNLYVKLESYNMTGSIKIRPAFNILKSAISNDIVTSDTTVIESTSGNFGLGLATICRKLEIPFMPVIDPNITESKERLLRILASKVKKVTEMDETEGYLLNRIRFIKEYLNKNKNAFNPNQYQNPDNYLAYYKTLGEEISNELPKLDYVFISVSSGGTVTGLSIKLKEMFKDVKIIAVDIEGSLIFSDKAMPRAIPGIGASMRTDIIKNAHIDDHVILTHAEIIEGCHKLLSEQSIFAGGSSGAAYFAAQKFINKTNSNKDLNILFISPDGGNSYADTIYNDDWVNEKLKKEKQHGHEVF
ncbi:2,3-diaminopropionate biosynthesis protein SbnA [uncultured Kordia sp.]|uniref:2,3-diaminopropionate biosynthesis protein SbnA n=1 Tax=uncultured Kordia sp. TaxID=507699 RepID=UPI002610FDE1|nr:2,3-diaminopropionate biosynthesis protein SbnA [uncultured Kordia sp.]